MKKVLLSSVTCCIRINSQYLPKTGHMDLEQLVGPNESGIWVDNNDAATLTKLNLTDKDLGTRVWTMDSRR